MACGIYKIENLVTGSVYIGQSIDISRRWRDEKADAFNERASSYETYLSRAFRKYCKIDDKNVPDFSNFSFEVLEECSADQLNSREQFYIDKFDSFNHGYNMTVGGAAEYKYVAEEKVLTKDQVFEIVKCLQTELLKSSDEIGKQFGISGRMVRNINNGTCHHLDSLTYPIRPRFISNPRNEMLRIEYKNGKQVTKTAKTVISKCPNKNILFEQLYNSSFTAVGKLYGVSATTVQKWLKQFDVPSSIKEFKLWYAQEILQLNTQMNQSLDLAVTSKYKAIPIKQFTLNGQYITRYQSLNAAARAVSTNNFGSVHIKEVCEGKRKSAYGFFWQFDS